MRRWGALDRNRAATIGIVALLVLNVVLVALAMRPRHNSQDAAVRATAADAAVRSTATRPADAAADASGSPTQTASPSSTPSSNADVTIAVPLELMVSAVSDRVAWQATSGSCTSVSAPTTSVERSTDGGRTWKRAEVPAPVVMRLKASSGSKAFVVSASTAKDGCSPGFQSTSGGGWSGAGDVSSAWYRSPSDPDRLGAPGGTTSRPCGRTVQVVDLVPDGVSRAGVLCADQRVMETTDAGQSWGLVATVPGGMALAAAPSGSGYVTAALGQRGCAGIAVVSVRKEPRQLGCVTDVTSAVPGRIAISTGGSATWLLAGSAVLVSTDGAASFERRAG